MGNNVMSFARVRRIAALLLAAVSISGGARAETLSEALIRVYATNPQLRAQRADTRATDETLPAALAGYRPSVSVSASEGVLSELYRTPGANGTLNTYYLTHPAGVTAQLTQNLFNGFRTYSQVTQALSQIMSSRESLRYAELSVFANAVGAYMDVLRDSAIVELRTNNVRALEKQLDDTCVRLKDGEVTATDKSQAEAALSQSRIELVGAETALKSSLALYEQFAGAPPKSLAPVRPMTAPLPRTLEEAYRIADGEHPLILAAGHNIEAAEQAVRIAEGSLLPKLDVTASVSQQYNYASIEGQQYTNYAVAAQLTVPVYDGGTTYAQIRQAKEKLGQAEALADQQRDQVRATVAQAFAAWQNSHRTISNAYAEVRQDEAALAGIREEARLGQRTTFDILYAQQQLLGARVVLVTAQHDAVVASFSLLAAIGRLSAQTLGIAATTYNAANHFDRVKGKWIGLDP